MRRLVSRFFGRFTREGWAHEYAGDPEQNASPAVLRVEGCEDPDCRIHHLPVTRAGWACEPCGVAVNGHSTPRYLLDRRFFRSRVGGCVLEVRAGWIDARRAPVPGGHRCGDMFYAAGYLAGRAVSRVAP